MQRSKKMLAVAATAAVVQLGIVSQTNAATVSWDGGGTDDNLLTPANWVGDAVPLPADTAIFLGSTRTTPITDGPGDITYRTLTFGAGASAFTIGGPNSLVLGSTTAGNYLINDTVGVTQTITAGIKMVGGTVTATQGALVLDGLFNVGNNGNGQVTFTGSNAITLSGGITGTAIATSDNGRIIKTGAGTLFVTDDSAAWAGRVQINAGAVQISHANALGSGGGTIFTGGNANTGTLELTGGFTLTKNVQTNGRELAAVNSVSLRNVGGNNTVNNVATSTGGLQFNYESVADNLTINNWTTTGSGGSRTLRVLGAGNGEIVNWTPVAGNVVTVIKDGAGTWSLRAGMNNANGVFGPVTVNSGTLVFDGGVGARVVGSATVAPNVTVNSGGTLQVVSPDGLSGEVGNGALASTLNIKAGGTLNASTFTNYSLQVNQTLVAGGTLNVGAGQLSAFGDNGIHIGDATTPGAGTMTVQGNLSLSSDFGTAAGGLYFDLSDTTTIGGGVNDLISVQGNLLIDAFNESTSSAAPISIKVNPIGAGLASGTYRLIDYTGPSTLNASDFAVTLGGGTASRQSLALATAANQLNLVVSGSPANLVWQGDGAGNAWEVLGATNNWLNGATPDQFYQFDNVVFDSSNANTTVNLTGSLTPSTTSITGNADYTFAGSGALAGGTLTKSGTGTLTIANTGPNTFAGAITINDGALQIGNGGADGSIGGGAIANSGALIINKTAATVLANVISGSGAVIKRGAGDMTLNAANTYTGATTIETGRMFVTNGASLGDAAGGTTVANNAQAFFTVGQTNAEPFTIAGDGIAPGEGAIRAGGAAITNLTGPVTLSGAASMKVDGGAQLNLSNTVTGTDTTLTLRGDTNSFGRLNAAVSLGAGSVIKEGTGTWILTGTGHSWTGGTTVNTGTLQIGEGAVGGDLPAGAITVTTPGVLAFGTDQVISFNRTVTGTGTIAQGNGGGTTTLSGDLSGFTGTLATSQGGVVSTLVVPISTGAANALVASSTGGNGVGILRLAHSNALAGNATITLQSQQTGGTGRLELSGGIDIAAGTLNVSPRNNASATILSVDGSNTLSGNMNIFTGGDFTTLEAAAGAQLTFGGTIQPGAGVGSNRNLVLQGEGDGTVGAVIQNQAGSATVSINVVKNGAGAWSLTGANTYIGTTTVNAGTLNVTPAAIPAGNVVNVNGGTYAMAGGAAFRPGSLTINAGQATVAAGGDKTLDVDALSIAGGASLNLNDNDLLVDYPEAGPSPEGTIRQYVRDGRAAGSISGIFVTPGPTADDRTLAIADNAEWGKTAFGGFNIDASTIVGKYTYFGDSNLDGAVTGDDYLAVDSNLGTGTSWIDGDFNLDNAVTGDDYLAIDTNLGKGTPNPLAFAELKAEMIAKHVEMFGEEYLVKLAEVEANGFTTVPEPGALSLIGLGAIGLLGRRRRRA